LVVLRGARKPRIHDLASLMRSEGWERQPGAVSVGAGRSGGGPSADGRHQTVAISAGLSGGVISDPGRPGVSAS